VSNPVGNLNLRECQSNDWGQQYLGQTNARRTAYRRFRE